MQRINNGFYAVEKYVYNVSINNKLSIFLDKAWQIKGIQVKC